MGNFLIVVAPQHYEAEAGKLFRLGLRNAELIKNQIPDSTIETRQVCAATYPRQNGTGSTIVTDEQSGSWLLTVGTWFHSQGFDSGDESNLLARAMEIGTDKLANELADKLEGFFVVVFADERTRELYVITDIIGSRHCFVRDLGEATVISTSSLLLASLSEFQTDLVGAEEFLRTGVIYEDRTFFREVRKLAPATVFRFAAGKLVENRRYWRMADLDPDRFDGKRATRKLINQLITAAARIGKRFTRPVCDLTGGYDSRALVAAFLSAGVRFETTVAGSAESSDVLIAESLSKLTGKLHWHLENESCESFDQLQAAMRLTDGEYDLTDYTRIQSLHNRLSLNFDVSINGSFGELARGYWWELLPKLGKLEKLNSADIAVRRYANEPDNPLLFPVASSLNLSNHLAEVIERANADLSGWPTTALMDNAYLNLRMQRWQGRIASSTDQIWPCLSPFMFRSVLDVMLQTGARWRRNSLLMRMALAELNPRLAAHALDSGHPALPMTWQNWPRFLPAVSVYIQRAITKAADRIGLAKSAVNNQSPRLRLWQDDQVRALLQPETMLLGDMIERRKLTDFLASSQQQQFAFDRQWQRLLSMEMTLSFAKTLASSPPPEKY